MVSLHAQMAKLDFVLKLRISLGATMKLRDRSLRERNKRGPRGNPLLPLLQLLLPETGLKTLPRPVLSNPNIR